MRWSLEHPDKLLNAVVIASAMKLTAQNIAFNELFEELLNQIQTSVMATTLLKIKHLSTASHWSNDWSYHLPV